MAVALSTSGGACARALLAFPCPGAAVGNGHTLDAQTGARHHASSGAITPAGHEPVLAIEMSSNGPDHDASVDRQQVLGWLRPLYGADLPHPPAQKLAVRNDKSTQRVALQACSMGTPSWLSTDYRAYSVEEFWLVRSVVHTV